VKTLVRLALLLAIASPLACKRTLTNFSITVLFPNGGEGFVISSTQTVQWTSVGADALVVIEYTTDGSTFSTLAASTANDGSEIVTMPSTPSTTAQIRVRTASNGLSDLSDYPFSVNAQLTDIAAPLTAATGSSAAWGDIDSDGDLDLVVAASGFWRNDAGIFTNIPTTGLIGVGGGSVALGDYDNDGNLDVALAGTATARIYHNNADETFTDLSAGLLGVSSGSVAWGDYDSDGDLDLAVAGTGTFRIYRNDAGAFTDIVAGLTGLSTCSIAWGDYDSDGLLDIVGAGDTGTPTTTIYQNLGAGVFSAIAAGLTGVKQCSLAWGDYDGDGFLDLAVAGLDVTPVPITTIYDGDGTGGFVNIGAALTGVRDCTVAWGDVDDDGDSDLVIAGNDGAASVTRVYRNAAGFTDITAGLVGADAVAWGDYDNDGDLDLVVLGPTVGKIYRNNESVLNAAPAAPGGLVATPGAGSVALSWTVATDDHTTALTYNLFVGTATGTSGRYPAMADGGTGVRRVARRGPVGGAAATLTLPSGAYFWRVQAVDSSFLGGAVSVEGTFTIP